MKAGTDLEQRAGAAINAHLARGRRRDLGYDLKKCALAGTIAPNDTDDLSLFDREGYILERPEGLDIVFGVAIIPAEAHKAAAPLRQGFGYPGVTVVNTPKIFLAYTANVDCRRHRRQPRSFKHV